MTVYIYINVMSMFAGLYQQLKDNTQRNYKDDKTNQLKSLKKQLKSVNQCQKLTKSHIIDVQW